MEIILLEKIANLGAMGDKVHVKPGYGRNYLIPQGKAAAATAENIAEYEARRAELEKASADALAAAQARRDQLLDKVITITSLAGEEGKLFGSVGTADIAHALTESGIPVERHEVRLPEGAFRMVGEHDVLIQLHTDVDVTIKLRIEAEK
ncbi:MAG: 50S ribosomal protein L9 [Gammaproteobacteria bacterium]|jgi:large subunit ribosomal protein L9|nr:50S ribosomal protein L9 [Gammaproteobacteria bacterium]